ncbi:MAG: LysE family translocator [Thermoguttaceae bacterium]
MFSIASGYLSACVLGSIFGFQGSVSPGPLQTVIISETLSNGIRSSWRAAVIPLCTDPIALCVALFVVANVPNSILAAIAFLGASLLLRVALLQFRTTENDFKFHTKKRLSLFSIWATNILNPNLWIFAFTINAFQIHDYYIEGGLGVAATYLFIFFLVLCVCNLSVACIVAALKRVFNPLWLVRINRVLGVFLLFVAVRFVILGLTKLGVIGEGLEETAITTLSNLTQFVC